MSHLVTRRAWGGTELANLVVVIEDDANLRSNVDFLLKAERIRSMTASDGRTGFALIRKHRPKVVILDMYLPHMSGFEVIDEIRSDPLLQNVFVVAVTGMADDADDLREMKGKADVIMGKPLDESHMIDLIRVAFENEDSASGLRRHLDGT
jgi:DNA-binding response OmpR family regulator